MHCPRCREIQKQASRHDCRDSSSTASSLQAPECKHLGSKPCTKMVGQSTIGAARPRRWSVMRPIRVGRRSVQRGHAIRHAGTAHAGESRIKIPCSIPSAVARRPVRHTVVTRYNRAQCISSLRGFHSHTVVLREPFGHLGYFDLCQIEG